MCAKKSDAVKIKEMELKAARNAQYMATARQVIASPVVQLMGTVLAAEGAEKAGILSGRWAGALEGGVIAMVGLQALKDYGVLGATAVGLGTGLGSLTEGSLSGTLDVMKFLPAPFNLIGLLGDAFVK